MPSSGDADLDELRRLAIHAPIDELMSRGLVFVSLVGDTYPADVVLWQGIERMSDAVLDGYPLEDERFARVLAQTIEFGDQQLAARLLPKAKRLRQLR